MLKGKDAYLEESSTPLSLEEALSLLFFSVLGARRCPEETVTGLVTCRRSVGMGGRMMVVVPQPGPAGSKGEVTADGETESPMSSLSEKGKESGVSNWRKICENFGSRYSRCNRCTL